MYYIQFQIEFSFKGNHHKLMDVFIYLIRVLCVIKHDFLHILASFLQMLLTSIMTTLKLFDLSFLHAIVYD